MMSLVLMYELILGVGLISPSAGRATTKQRQCKMERGEALATRMTTSYYSGQHSTCALATYPCHAMTSTQAEKVGLGWGGKAHLK